MNCPFCNQPMSDLESDDMVTCTNAECKANNVILPIGLVPISTGALINLMSHIDNRISNLPKILTKERQGRKDAYTELGMLVMSTLKQLGFHLVDGQLVLKHAKNPISKS